MTNSLILGEPRCHNFNNGREAYDVNTDNDNSDKLLNLVVQAITAILWLMQWGHDFVRAHDLNQWRYVCPPREHACVCAYNIDIMCGTLLRGLQHGFMCKLWHLR